MGRSKKWSPTGVSFGTSPFLIYINDIDEAVESTILKFADDTKVCGIARTQEEVDNLHKDLLNLCQWSQDWLMLFNVDKCKVLHFGHGNKGARYTMNGKELDSVLEEKDLGVIIQHDLKWGRQCAKAASTGNRVLGMITRSFTFKSRDIILQLY